MSNGRFPAIGVSLVMHSILLVALAMIQYNLQDDQSRIAIESVYSEERLQQEFHRELEQETEISETMTTVSGGVVSTNVASAAGPTAQTVNIETSTALHTPEIKINPGDITMPGDALMAMDLGEGEVDGEVGAWVDGYGAALAQITQELVRMMRQQKVLVVWLFDKSESMKDDQAEIRENFHKVYEELGIVTKKDQELRRRGEDILLTSIWAFGEQVQEITPQPTADIDEIRAAIDKVPIDPSGVENTCMAISAALDKFRVQASRQRRKLVVICVTDESGDDHQQLLEPTLNRARQAKAPIYFLGREAIFGYPKARIRWQDPKYGLWHWVWIDRGPETAFPECLQWDGLHERHDVYSSGFGPYNQVRLAKETGGIFFVLPSEEEDLTGAGAREQRRFDALDMKEYEPLLVSRREYIDNEVNPSRFRTAIMKVIEMLDPAKDQQLRIRSWHYPVDAVEFRREAAEQVVRAARAMTVLNEVIPIMEALQPLRAKEDSQRWRAHYDLIMAQLYCYRVRLFQYLLAMDHHAHTNPKPSDPKHNEWHVARVVEQMVPDDPQFERIKVTFKVRVSKEEYLAELKKQEDKARELFAFVMENHPRTPWSQRARHELNSGFGMKFVSHFWDPNYNAPDIQVPKF